jgi:hypothetical protein
MTPKLLHALLLSADRNIATQKLHLKDLSIDLTYLTGARKPAELVQWLQRRRKDQTFAEIDCLEIFSDSEPLENSEIGLTQGVQVGSDKRSKPLQHSQHDAKQPVLA